MKYIVIVVSILFFQGCSNKVIVPIETSYINTYIDRAIDGDTVKLRDVLVFKQGNEIKYATTVKYIGIKAPERYERYYRSAKELNSKMLRKKKVRLEFDEKLFDTKNRIFAYVFVEENSRDIFVNAEMLKRGYAETKVEPPNIKYIELFAELEKEAKDNKRGKWQYIYEQPFKKIKIQKFEPRITYEPGPIYTNEQPSKEYKFVSSKLSKIFHTLSCPIAKNIKEENKIYYSTTEEAISAGKKPCKKCNPERHEE